MGGLLERWVGAVKCDVQKKWMNNEWGVEVAR